MSINAAQHHEVALLRAYLPDLKATSPYPGVITLTVRDGDIPAFLDAVRQEGYASGHASGRYIGYGEGWEDGAQGRGA